MADICILQVCSHYDWFLSGKVTVTAVWAICHHFTLMHCCSLHPPALMLHGKATTPEITIFSFLFPVLYRVLHSLTRLDWRSM